jgi:hypothetical protein
MMAHFFQLADMGYFWGAQCMQLDIRKLLLDLAKCIGIEIQAQFRMVAALQQQLITAILNGFADFLAVGVHISDIGISMARNAVEIAKLTIGNTNIGGIDISIDLPGHFSMGHVVFTHLISYIHQF